MNVIANWFVVPRTGSTATSITLIGAASIRKIDRTSTRASARSIFVGVRPFVVFVSSSNRRVKLRLSSCGDQTLFGYLRGFVGSKTSTTIPILLPFEL